MPQALRNLSKDANSSKFYEASNHRFKPFCAITCSDICPWTLSIYLFLKVHSFPRATLLAFQNSQVDTALTHDSMFDVVVTGLREDWI